MKELTINVGKDFNKILGGREEKISQFSGEMFRENFLEENIKIYDRIIIELDGVLGYPVDFLDETFGKMARRLGKKRFREVFIFVSMHPHVIQRIEYLVEHAGKE